jgi:hypothetical protein
MALPDHHDVDRWLQEIIDSDVRMAETSAEYGAARENLKVQKAIATPGQGTVQERENVAIMSAGYKVALERIKEAEYNKLLCSLKRESARIGIDIWRSINASQRLTL